MERKVPMKSQPVFINFKICYVTEKCEWSQDDVRWMWRAAENQFFAAMCLHLVNTCLNLQKIDHKFFEKGHREIECDSIHSKIEQKSKHMPVYVPEGWAQVITCARLNPKLFQVETLLFSDFYDFKQLANDVIPKIPWRKVC